MNIININEENNSNIEKKVNENHINKLEIDLLETINEKDLFKNIENHDKIRNNFIDNKKNLITQNKYINDNFQLNIDEIVDESNNIINQNFEDLNENDINKNFIEQEKFKNNENYIDFNSFMLKKNEKTNKLNKIFRKIKEDKIKMKKTFSHLRKNIKNLKNENTKMNETHKKTKIKYSKERIEINKQRINNLYNDYQKILNIRKKKKEELSKEEIKDCSFSPKINENSKKIIENNSKFSRPIFLRYNNDKERKNILIQKYSQNFTHIPKINKNYKIHFHPNTINQIKERYKIIKNHQRDIHEQVKNANILKRQLMLDEYIIQRKINSFNNDINLSHTQISQFSNKVKINSQNNFNKSQIYPTLQNLKSKNKKYTNKNKHNEYNQNKIIEKSKSFHLDCIKDINKNVNNNINIIHKQKIIPIISIDKIGQYFKYNNRSFIIANNKEKDKENVVQNYINKINDNIYYRNNSRGICYNITEQCMNLKKIIFKNKNKFRIYK